MALFNVYIVRSVFIYLAFLDGFSAAKGALEALYNIPKQLKITTIIKFRITLKSHYSSKIYFKPVFQNIGIKPNQETFFIQH